MKIIGFANQFYTLWDCEVEKKYTMDSYGKYHQSGTEYKYFYNKNIAIDLAKVKALYPDLVIDEGLRGKTVSFTRSAKQDLPANFFWFGKYYGRLIDEILISDFDYCLWAANNSNASDYIKQTPEYIAYFAKIEAEKAAKLEAANVLKAGSVIELDFIYNGYVANEKNEVWSKATFGDVQIDVKPSGAKKVEGMYPYYMPIINGKAQKTKGKRIKVTVSEVIDTYINYDNSVKQIIRIA